MPLTSASSRRGGSSSAGPGKGEPFVSLDGKTRNLNAETLMICDGRKPVAIAGIMGGENSEVKEDTETVLLESAYFNPSTIRRGARFLGMGTDAAFRFERGIDPEGVVRALDRAAQLIADLSGGTVCKGHIDTYPKKVAVSGPITLRMKRVGDILGTPVKASEARDDLQEPRDDREDGRARGDLSVTPPTFRVDLWREIDLIEEIARLHGYDRIPVTIPPIPAPGDIHDRKREFESAVRTALNGQGFTEVLNYSFISAAVGRRARVCPRRMSAAGSSGSPIRSPRTRPSCARHCSTGFWTR